ncbi:MAG: type II toxin-antitoxin system VapB family antitoxin [Bacteroidia bacterium]
MATNLNIDPNLLEEAQKTGGLKSKKDTVTLALREFIQRRKQLAIISLFGTIDYAEDFDYKKHRKF